MTTQSQHIIAYAHEFRGAPNNQCGECQRGRGIKVSGSANHDRAAAVNGASPKAPPTLRERESLISGPEEGDVRWFFCPRRDSNGVARICIINRSHFWSPKRLLFLIIGRERKKYVRTSLYERTLAGNSSWVAHKYPVTLDIPTSKLPTLLRVSNLAVCVKPRFQFSFFRMGGMVRRNQGNEVIKCSKVAFSATPEIKRFKDDALSWAG